MSAALPFSTLFAVAVPIAVAGGWEISGKVTDRAGLPLDQAQVCVEGSTHCVNSAADGTFAIGETSTEAVLGGTPARASARPSLAIRDGRLFLVSPEHPSGTPVTWKLLMGSSAGVFHFPWEAGEAAAPALAKPSAAVPAPVPALSASKSGYRSRKYFSLEPARDTLAWILLAASADDTTYKLPGSSYPAAAVPPNEPVGRTEFWKCAHCYGGAKAAQLLGHSATGKGTIQFNRVYAPADGNYDVTWGYYCGASDNNGDKDCGGEPHTAAGCRPGILVIDGQELSKVYQFPCFATSWNFVHFVTFSLPLKQGANSIKIYSKTADVADFDRLIVADGR
jgi:hypothetical protein